MASIPRWESFMTLHFVMNELGVYLDTHSNDTEALDMFRQVFKAVQRGHGGFCKALRADNADAGDG
jgi:hypothetical protein